MVGIRQPQTAKALNLATLVARADEVIGGKLFGAVGCSGGTGDQDPQFCKGWR
jgi:hypothetical protein